MKTRGLHEKVAKLEAELRTLKLKLAAATSTTQTVITPDPLEPFFLDMELQFRKYFSELIYDPDSGEISIRGQRYVLFRSDSLGYDFHEFILERYSDRSPEEATSIATNFAYDNAKVIGKKDSVKLSASMGLKTPLERLAAGPVHFAFTGWANVEIYPESNPVADESYLLKYRHHNSFEAQSWIKAGKKSTTPVCTMNSGYAAGWCEEAFGIPLTAVELTCEAMGHDACTFVMAPTDKIQSYLGEMPLEVNSKQVEIPVFFKRKEIEEKLKETLEQKDVLLKEIHHRVKNNMQVIVSLLRLQLDGLREEEGKQALDASINRVSTMAIVHDLMYRRKDVDCLGMRCYFEELFTSLVKLYNLNQDIRFDLKIDVADRSLGLEASIPLALILNEITCNAFKHGIQSGDTFYLHLTQSDSEYILTVGDTGGGFKEKKSTNGLGLALVEILCDQLDARLEISNTKKGLEYTITFRLPDSI